MKDNRKPSAKPSHRSSADGTSGDDKLPLLSNDRHTDPDANRRTSARASRGLGGVAAALDRAVARVAWSDRDDMIEEIERLKKLLEWEQLARTNQAIRYDTALEALEAQVAQLQAQNQAQATQLQAQATQLQAQATQLEQQAQVPPTQRQQGQFPLPLGEPQLRNQVARLQAQVAQREQRLRDSAAHAASLKQDMEKQATHATLREQLLRDQATDRERRLSEQQRTIDRIRILKMQLLKKVNQGRFYRKPPLTGTPATDSKPAPQPTIVPLEEFPPLEVGYEGEAKVAPLPLAPPSPAESAGYAPEEKKSQQDKKNKKKKKRSKERRGTGGGDRQDGEKVASSNPTANRDGNEVVSATGGEGRAEEEAKMDGSPQGLKKSDAAGEKTQE